jgi:hypothetical protein
MFRRLLQPSRIFRVTVVLLAVAIVGGCSTFGNPKFNEKDFSEMVDAFNTALRWRDFKSASAFVLPEVQEEFWQMVDSMDKRVRLTEYEVRNVAWNDKGQPVSVFIRYQYFFMSNPELRSKTIHQEWVYDERISNWQIAALGLEPLVD